MVLLPLICSHLKVPVVAAGGIADGRSMAAAFVLRTKTTEAFEGVTTGDPMALLGTILNLYQHGELEGTLPQCGQVAGRIDEVLPARVIIERTLAEFEAIVGALSSRYVKP